MSSAMALHLFFEVLAAVLVLFTLPLLLDLLLLTLAALWFARSRKIGKPSQISGLKSLAVIIPAHNEEVLLARAVQSLNIAKQNLHLQDANIAVRTVVIAHNCTDATTSIARNFGAEVLELNAPALKGKHHALAYAFDQLRDQFEAFFVIDADSLLSPEALVAAADALQEHKAIQGRYTAIPDMGSPRSLLTGLAFRGMNVVRARGRMQLGLSCGIFGNGFALRTELLDLVSCNTQSVAEDLEFHLALLHAGVRVQYVESVMVQSEIANTRQQRARWEGGRLRLVLQSLPTMLLDVLRGRWRLIEPALDLAGLPLAQEVFLLLLALCLPFFWIRVYALAGFAILGLYVSTAAHAGPNPQADFLALLRAPGYVFRKLVSLPAILRSSRRQAEWVRTERGTQQINTAPNNRKDHS